MRAVAGCVVLVGLLCTGSGGARAEGYAREAARLDAAQAYPLQHMLAQLRPKDKWSQRMGQEPHAAGKHKHKEKMLVDPFSVGIGLGKYGHIGGFGLLRPNDAFGLEFGVGAWFYDVDYEVFEDDGAVVPEDEFGAAPAVGLEPHFYFTPRTVPMQHSVNLGAYYSPAFGPAFSLAYGFEQHFRHGPGFDFSIGAVIATESEEYLEDYLDADEVDFDWIPVLIELGMFF